MVFKPFGEFTAFAGWSEASNSIPRIAPLQGIGAVLNSGAARILGTGESCRVIAVFPWLPNSKHSVVFKPEAELQFCSNYSFHYLEAVGSPACAPWGSPHPHTLAAPEFKLNIAPLSPVGMGIVLPLSTCCFLKGTGQPEMRRASPIT